MLILCTTNHNIDCWIVTNVSEVTNSISATSTSSDVAPSNVQIDFSSLLSQLTVATSATNNMGNINMEQLMQLRQMIEVLTTKSGEIITSTVETMYAPNTSTMLAEHTTVIDSTPSTFQLIDTNNETLEQCGGKDTTLTREGNEMILSLKVNPTNNKRTHISSVEKEFILSEEKRVNISDITTVGIPTNNDVDESKKITETIESVKVKQRLSSCDKPTTEVALLVKSRTDDVTSSVVKSKAKLVKRNLQLPNETTVTRD